jgi:molybdopterin-containing oxidoreductase family iron-sulfur binding subunit
MAGGTSLASGIGLTSNVSAKIINRGKKVKVLTADGRLVEVDSSLVSHHAAEEISLTEENIREGIEGRKFVMVIDLARCGNERKCVEGCQKMHNLLPPVEYIHVKRMQDTELTAPYWFPQPCYHCDNPPCTKVCPVDATFKRSDGIVAVDNDRCIGCKFCMAACPYSARTFNFGRPQQVEYDKKHKCEEDNCCHTKASTVGTVYKCDFCPGAASRGKLPTCVTECPNGVLFFGDENEDTVTNGEETFRLKELLKTRAAYRQFEELGTKPRVYYLPPDKRQFPFEEATEVHNQDE